MLTRRIEVVSSKVYCKEKTGGMNEKYSRKKTASGLYAARCFTVTHFKEAKVAIITIYMCQKNLRMLVSGVVFSKSYRSH